MPDSKANFVFASHNKIEAKRLFEKLKEKGILIRYFEKPRIDKYVRITIGTKSQMESVILAIKQIAEECGL